MPAPSIPVRRRWTTVAFIATAVVAWAGVAGVAAIATQLRPIADDYCHASIGLGGFGEAYITWFTTWIGDASQLAVTVMLVGQTLAHLPLELASAIPFLATAAGVVALAVLLGSSAVQAGSRARIALIAAPAIALLWWSFWWLPTLTGGSASTNLLALVVTDWQVVNVQYVLTPALLLMLYLFLRRHDSRWAIASGLLVGLLIGTGGLVFAAAALLGIAILETISALEHPARRRATVARTAMVLAGGLIGLAVAMTAPGAAARSASLVDTRPLGATIGPFELIAWVFPRSLGTLWEAATTSGTALAAVGGGVLAMLLAPLAGARLDPRRLGWIAIGAAVFAVVISVVARAGSGVTYEGYWHATMPTAAVFIAAIAAGAALGAGVSDRVLGGYRTGAIAVLIAVIVAALVVVSVIAMRIHVADRLAAWGSGAAPGAASDIEEAWVQECWLDLQVGRPDLPERLNR